MEGKDEERDIMTEKETGEEKMQLERGIKGEGRRETRKMGEK